MALNNRRLAFVNAGVIPVFIYFALKPSKIKRRVNRAAILLGLLGVVYLIIAAKMESDSVVFKPARLILSAISQSDTSSESRDVENFNLIYTLRQSPIVGQGFGHGYIEKYHLYDISDLFKLYLFIPHNGVLWIWEVGGVVGFTLLWFIYPVTMTFALRAYRIGRNAVERSAGLAAAATVVACVAQIWGDQGFNSYMTLVIFGVAYAVAVRVETASVQGT
jgi:O-antigen ligase